MQDSTARWYAPGLDGRLVCLRPVQPDDLSGLRELVEHCSEQSVYERFFSLSRKSAETYVDRLVTAMPGRRVLVATVCNSIVGVGECTRVEGGVAEIALLVAQQEHHDGIGTLLLEQLTTLARDDGISVLRADVLADNAAMLDVLQRSGFRTRLDTAAGTVRAEIDIAPALAAAVAVGERERVSTARSLEPLLAPHSIVVVGASARTGSVGHEVLRNILAGGYTGQLSVANPHHDVVLGVPCVATAQQLPAAPDLAIVAVPASQVLDVIRGCGVRGVRGIVLLTAGYGETGQEGRAAQAQLLATVRDFGMRLVGPNCLGLLNTDPAVRLNATFATLSMQPGRLGLASQSGALGIAVAAAAERRGLGLAQFVSMGNKADVSGNDLLLAWEGDPRVQVIALYLESVGNPRRFARIASRVASSKPILALKAGRSSAGQRAGMSHTAAAAASDVAVDALFVQAGVIRVSGIDELLDCSRVLCDQPLPTGNRVAIVGNSGGPGILAADAAEAAGLSVVLLGEATQQALRAAVPALASCQNPVDLGAAVDPEQYGEAVRCLLSDGDVDALLTVYTDVAVTDADQIMAQTAAAAASGTKPVIATRVGALPGSVTVPEWRWQLPVFGFPEPAATALAAAVHYASIRTREPAVILRPSGIDRLAARAAVARCRAAGLEWLDPDSVSALLSAYGIPVSEQRVVCNAAQAASAAETLGYPLAVKLALPGVHKTERGGVRLGITNPTELASAVAAVQAAGTQDAGTEVPVLLQPMNPTGVELIVGAVQHAEFGPLVMLGAGGTLADLLADRTFRLAPLSVEQATAMIEQLRVSRLLDGFRGGPVVSRSAVADIVCRVSALVDDLPEVLELDLNPLIGTSDRLLVVDARIRIGEPAPVANPLNRLQRG